MGTWSVGAFEREFHLLPLSHHLLPSREVAPMSSDWLETETRKLWSVCFCPQCIGYLPHHHDRVTDQRDLEEDSFSGS